MPAEPTQLMYSHKELVTALVKDSDLHEGIWALSVNFGFGAANMGSNPEADDLNPTAVIPLLKVGLQRVDALNALAVDAAVVNPK
ncbi:hypothetical protein PPGU19_011680 [Paraburkholderia sp. PGU19]|uniref:hypothetical protein n=1 Tax=Paraburkholderia sp. PGU19 TaxID=2735434 RepID=UPI0015DA34A0|nr:hypothetical protein [Paraburkholderia sp. PGU19]BCF96599.1 hypothetical protein PPGU19_011680 [Paraburkholderia sp. PGU19]